MGSNGRKFPPIAEFRQRHGPPATVAADLDGTLLASSSSFPYFLLLSYTAGGILRSLLLVLCAPLILALYKLVSESAAIRLLIFVSVSGLHLGDITAASASILPELYAANVRSDAWELFDSCSERRVVVTANPRIMVEPFAIDCLGAHAVLGTELEVGQAGRLTGFLTGDGVLVGKLKRQAVLREFEKDQPDVGLGDRTSDHDFMALCKEAYMVPSFKKGSSREARVNRITVPWTKKKKEEQRQSGRHLRDLPFVLSFLIKMSLPK
ncbi:Glycerol-3-phosphate 2-O-acyltransferase 4 [Nymphaea thermarum]|nr:Glycerol-3-phosphate 2-O-acyltransferase 4 [Nymphaea thermarum]